MQPGDDVKGTETLDSRAGHVFPCRSLVPTVSWHCAAMATRRSWARSAFDEPRSR